MSKTTDAAETLIAELRGSCGPHVIAGINGNLPPGWQASQITAHRRLPSPSQRVAVFCNGDQIGMPFADGVGAKVEVEAGTAEADHLRIADKLAERLRAALDAWGFIDGRADDPTRTQVIRIALAPGAVLPERKTSGASGYDLCALAPFRIEPGRVATVDTGVTIELPAGMEAQVRPRSGLAARGIWGTFGSIDADYRGTIRCIMANLGTDAAMFAAGDRIAQLVFARVEQPELQVVEVGELTATERGACGLGSTGNR